MHRFFADEISGGTARILGEDVKHIRKVLRLGPGDIVSVCDGNGTDYEAVIRSVSAEEAELELVSSAPSETEPGTRVTLYQCLPKAGKMETIIQKCTELGVCAVVPVLSARCVTQPGERFGPRLERYRKVAEEAAKQSRRGRIPEVRDLVRIRDIVPEPGSLLLVCYEEERETTLKEALRSAPVPASVGIVIGPEGGLEPEEVRALEERGGHRVTLGRRILRTETAGMAVLAQVLYEVDS